MSKRSAGILLYKRSAGELLVLLAHPGGPFWQKRDLGAWTIPRASLILAKLRRMPHAANSAKNSGSTQPDRSSRSAKSRRRAASR
jgi:predicted NUDIX family NTP pyrophosphohydrolase